MPNKHHRNLKHYPHARHPQKSPQFLGKGLPLFAFIILGFALLISIGFLLLLLPSASADGNSADPIDAFFTSTSAVTDTGLVTVNTAQQWSTFGQNVILVLIQCGGLGFMFFASAVVLLARRRVNLMDFRFRDTLGTSNSRSFLVLFLQTLALTIVVESVGTYLFWRNFQDDPIDNPLWHSIFYSISAFNNAGFDLSTNTSLIGYNTMPYLLMSAAGLTVIGGLSVPVIFELLEKFKRRELSIDTKLALTTTLILLLGGAAVILILEYSNPGTLGGMNTTDRMANAFFTSVVPRSSGFTSLDMGIVKDATLMFIMMLMFVGGVTGSTAGGIKVNTVSTLFLTAFSYVRGRTRVVVFSRQIPEVEIHRAISIFFCSLVFILIIAFALSALETASFMDILFETVSAFSTAGLSVGITPALTTASQLILCLAMFTGRIGLLVMIMALARPSHIIERRYPQADVRIG